MATDETDGTAGAVSTQSGDDAPVDGAEAALPRLSLDDLRLRLDSPLFARDPGLSPQVQVPRLKELTWEHVVNPNSHQAPEHADDAAVEPATDHAAEETVAAVTPRITVPEPVPVTELQRPPSIEDLLSSPSEPAAEPVVAEPVVAEAVVAAAPGAVTAGEAPAPLHVPAARALPSLAASLGSGEVPTIEDAFFQIVEPAPTPREPDPVVHGLAELIVRATPAGGQPAVEAPQPEVAGDDATAPAEDDPEVDVEVDDTVTAATEGDTGAAGDEPAEEAPTPQTISSRLAALPSFDELAAHQPISEAVPVVPVDDEVPPARTTGSVTTVQPSVGDSAVEAELNRLAFLPDQDEDDGPVEVPAIALSDSPPPVVPASLSLASHEVYQPRTATNPARRTSYVDMAIQAAEPVRRKRKRHVGRGIVTTLLLLGLLGAGLFAVKYYVLDTKWDSAVQPLAADVETARGLQFDEAVEVHTLPAEEYAVELSRRSLGITDENIDAIAAQWRALGLLSGVLDEQSVGMAALPDSPAFYDPGSGSVYVVADLPDELHTFAMHRALAMALLDQEYGWSSRVKDGAPAIARGTRALYDADALAVAEGLVADTDRPLVLAQLFELYGTYDIPTTPSPFASTVAGRLGVAMWPFFRGASELQRDVVERDASLADASVLDLRRLSTADVGAVNANAEGMLFWYHVLAARVDDDLAWRAALSWQNDDLAVMEAAGDQCVSATFEASPTGAADAEEAFRQWAAAAPADAPATVSAVDAAGGRQLSISACDPGADVSTNDGSSRLSLGGAPLRAEQYRRLLDEQPGFGAANAACAVYGNDSIGPADERAILDTPEGWTAPSQHPAPDTSRVCAG